MSKEKEQISITSQEEIFECCFCGKDIASYDSYMALGCHIKCARVPPIIKQLLHNYLFMLKQEVKSIPEEEAGNIEFTEDEIKRVEQAIRNEKE